MKICPQCGAEYELDQRFCPKDGSTLRTQGGEGDMVGTVIADRYYVTKKLGEGGMGQVYLAEHVKMGRKSALKVMHQKMVQDADAIARFNREASNASRINHPNVAAIYDFGETPEGVIYLAMEFVEGEPLTKIIERQGALPPMRAAEIARQVAEALNVAHDMGIVHRDLKPDNIMIARAKDGADVVKVVDFGIAKAADSEGQNVTKTGLIVGTPEYMSPEQIAADRLDGRSDLYSLALVTFNMLTGKLPFPAASAQESLIMRLTEQPRTLSQMRPDVAWPSALQAVLDRALVRDMAQRYQKTTDFARDLVRAVEVMPDAQVAEGGTQVMSADSIPATRVATAPDLGGGATVAEAAPVAAAAPIAALPAEASKRSPATRSRVPLFAGIAAAVTLLLGGGAFMMKKGGVAAPADSAVQLSQQMGVATAPVAPVVLTPAQIVDSAMNVAVSNENDVRGATSALQVLDALRPQAEGATLDRVDIERVRAMMVLDQKEKACELADRILNRPSANDDIRNRLAAVKIYCTQ